MGSHLKIQVSSQILQLQSTDNVHRRLDFAGAVKKKKNVIPENYKK